MYLQGEMDEVLVLVKQVHQVLLVHILVMVGRTLEITVQHLEALVVDQ
jgi:hypothetical protein